MTLLELCTGRAVERTGRDPRRPFDVLRSVPQAMRACEVIAEWAIATVQGADGEVALTREYADYWRKSERQGERDRAKVRALFDPDEFDAVIVEVAGQLRRRGLRRPIDVRGVQGFDVSARVVRAA